MDFERAKEKLAFIEQSHLLNGWDHLAMDQREFLLEEIRTLDIHLFKHQRHLLKSYRQRESHEWRETVFRDHAQSGDLERTFEGRQLLERGKMGALLVAGGQGTRLGFEGPKGCFPISNVQGKTLFQLFAEKTLCASRLYGVSLSLAIMTSSSNHRETVDYFYQNKFFGLEEHQVDFFMQDDLPFLDRKGDMFLQGPDSIARGPNGNGTALKYFFESGLWEKWDRKGIKYVNFIMVDNPLADPFDAELLGYHLEHGDDVTIKCVLREDPAENLGVLVKNAGHVRIVEYTEVPEAERYARDERGKLKHLCGNVSLFCLSMQFVHDVALEDDEVMPYHLAFKSVEYFNESGETVKSNQPIAWKFEKYIFDMLARTDRVGVLVYPREFCFAPLKNKEGGSSCETVQKALLNYERELWRKIAGTEPASEIFELAQDFYYPTADLYEKWRGKKFPETKYIKP